MDKFDQIVISGILEGLERGLASGLYDAAAVRKDAKQILTKDGLPDELRKRAQLLATSMDGSSMLPS